jgi:hypothetical protein
MRWVWSRSWSFQDRSARSKASEIDAFAGKIVGWRRADMSRTGFTAVLVGDLMASRTRPFPDNLLRRNNNVLPTG